MVGGGEGSLIGAVHRLAARMDDRFELVAGALSADPARGRASAEAIGLAPERTYATYAEMARAEAARADGIEAVAIVTPNHLHFDPAMRFLDAGIHVICDKPMTTSLADAEALAARVAETGLVFALTHNYSGYPMVRQARAMVAAGEIGTVRVVAAEYVQDWLAEPVEATGMKQAEWRTDPARSGAGGSVGDIGTHAYHLTGFVTGLAWEVAAAELSTFVPGRRLDDNAFVLLKAGEARAMLWASQVAPGNRNALSLRVYGDRGGLEWRQEAPEELWFSPLGKERRLLTRGGPGTGEAARRVTRLPPGHPEGYFEAFATLYGEAADAIEAHRAGQPRPADCLVPTVEDGVAGVAFIEAAVRLAGR
ncbi:Gfo/Idh/MocA family protein [Acuticoccus mangrovi]|uniref:Gfo/Idh/MocA family oxidoreductase n=1 Tax=Acuticoccus mangrovi TaxID=2796142 RepID=A0A934IM29_9HYPH|nr:Gfo/Idh/MocA family oxidoreductase [Acuticoccus mangrovi]MBJ3776327.1 Gfo/Idh/MocA family oxidoreductase [Acuticoccus mangrovi]